MIGLDAKLKRHKQENIKKMNIKKIEINKVLNPELKIFTNYYQTKFLNNTIKSQKIRIKPYNNLNFVGFPINGNYSNKNNISSNSVSHFKINSNINTVFQNCLLNGFSFGSSSIYRISNNVTSHKLQLKRKYDLLQSRINPNKIRDKFYKEYHKEYLFALKQNN